MSMKQESTGGGAANGPSPLDSIRRFGPGAVISVIALLFIVQNQEAADFEFLWFDFTTGLWLMLAISVLAGVAIGLFAARRRSRRKKRAERKD